jgi:three-Cys-motif partner protein
MSKEVSSKHILLEHSIAKVKLYKFYLATYLNIMSRSPFNKIFLYDLMCGEGVYSDGEKGSPIATLEVIKDHYYSNGKKCPNIIARFNDNGMSDVEMGKSKIERVESFAAKVFRPTNVESSFTKYDYLEILPKVIKELSSNIKDSRALVFIDPHGYKSVKPNQLKDLLSCNNSEVLLFLPISFMYRFAGKAAVDQSNEYLPLYNFLNELYGGNYPTYSSVENFIEKLCGEFKTYLFSENVFVDAFTIERDAANTFALFFFTRHPLGYQAMLQAMWKLDPHNGRGFKKQNEPMLFKASDLDDYPRKLIEYIKSKEYRTNKELWIFGLQNRCLPKDTKPILEELQRKNVLEKISLDDKTIPKNAFYIGEAKRNIGFKINGN